MPVRSARDLGIYVDADLVMRKHVQRTVSRCFAVLRQLRQIRHSVPTNTQGRLHHINDRAKSMLHGKSKGEGFCSLFQEIKGKGGSLS